MTHDPLCYMAQGKWGGGCHCGLIAKVRADQREACIMWAVHACGFNEEFIRHELPLWEEQEAQP